MSATVVVSADLMDRSKIGAALADVVFVRTADAASEAGDDVTLVIVDLRLAGPVQIGALVEGGARVVAFGSHVDEDVLAAARDAGAEALPRSVFFRRLAEGAV